MQPNSCIMNTDSIERHIEIEAPVSRVWRALTDHGEFGRWFGAELEGPFAPGKTTAGKITGPGCANIPFTVTVQRMEAERYFSLTWHPYAVKEGVDYSKETPTLVEFRLAASQAGTRLSVKESGFDKLPAGRRSEAFRMHEQGWAEQMKNIRAHVA